MNELITLQFATQEKAPVAEEQLIHFAMQPLRELNQEAEVTLRFVDEEEIIALNATYRHKNQPTNVLAFPMEVPDFIPLAHRLLGDVVICPAVLQKESKEQHKALEFHWAHIIIHGVLHLLGYDHIEEADAIVMQELEIKLLNQLGFANPYLEGEQSIEQ